jgi:trimeric autotransporter adhesin
MDTLRHSTGNIAAMKITHIACIAAFFAVAGCQGSGNDRPPPSYVNYFDAAPNLEAVAFRREQDFSNSVQLSYALGQARTRYDSGPYDFHLQYSSVNPGAQEVDFSETLSPDQVYTFVAVAPNGQPEVLKFAEDALTDPTTQRFTLVHAFEGLGDLDVYWEPPGTILSSAVPIGTISFAQDALPFEVVPGTYRLYLTTAGDPNDVLFESSNQTIVEAPERLIDDVLVVSDPAGQVTVNLIVSRVGYSRLGQEGVGSTLRVIQSITDRVDRDIYVDDTTSPPSFPAQSFGVFSDYTDVAFGTRNVIVTPVGNPGTEEFSFPYAAVSGGVHTILFSSNADGEIAAASILEDKRSIVGQATLTFFDGAGLFGDIYLYAVPPGTDITTLDPQLVMFAPGFSSRLPVIPGDYELTVKDAATNAILAGPEAITVEDGGVYGIGFVNGAGGSTVDFVYFDDFVP